MSKKQKRYVVSVERTGYAVADIEVMANDLKEAKRKAVQRAGEREFSEHSSDYRACFVTEIPEIKARPFIGLE